MLHIPEQPKEQDTASPDIYTDKYFHFPASRNRAQSRCVAPNT